MSGLGVFAGTRGLHNQFGDERVIDTPISELGVAGAGVGAAATGLRPVVDLMFGTFLYLAFDQIANQAGSMRYMFGGQATVASCLYDTKWRREVVPDITIVNPYIICL